VLFSPGTQFYSINQIDHHYDVTHDNASYTVTSDFDVLGRKFGYQKQRCLNAFYQFKIYLSFCLPVSIYVCVPVAIYYFGFPVFIDTIEGTNKRTNERTDKRINGQLFLIQSTHRFVRG
jgi:hypothetical protein